MSDAFDPAAEHARALLSACGPPARDLAAPDLRWSAVERSRPHSAVLEWAKSGAMHLTGSPVGAPQFADGALASAAAGAARALDALAPDSGFDRLDAPALLGERAAIAGLSRRGPISAGGSARLLATKHKAIVLNLPRDEDWESIPALFELDSSDFATQRDWDRLAALAVARNGEELTTRGRLMGLAISSVDGRDERGPDQPLFERHHTTHATHATHTAEPPAPLGRRRIRVLDLSSLWAGPLATSLLAQAGLEVLKLESTKRCDGARRGPKKFFDLLNGNKRGCALDLRSPSDLALFERLLESADVVVESARPRGLAQLGVEAERWVAARPGRIWASITGYGRAKDWIAFGDDAAVAAGLAFSPEPAQPTPRFCADAIADPLAGLHAAVVVLAHLRAGLGGLLDLSLVSIARHAASIPNEGLTRPVVQEGDRWYVVDGNDRVEIASPRARTPIASAPKLAAPDGALLAAWNGSC